MVFFWLFSQKKFAGKEKVVIFAARFDKNGQLFDNIER
jgi:hypothetical protein